MSTNVKELAGFLWSVADLLRGDYKQSDYGKVILPFTILRRLDCVLQQTKAKVLDWIAKNPQLQQDMVLNNLSGYNFHNRSKYDFASLVADYPQLAANLRDYIRGFSEDASDILRCFDFERQIERLEANNLLYSVVKKFEEIDLHPNRVSNMEMGYVFEELIRKFAEASNETAGEHFTPREVIRLMVDLLFIHDEKIFSRDGIIQTLYDCACGTGGMLSVSESYVHELNPQARLEVFGQELNSESYAICKADMLIKGQKASNIGHGNSFSEDRFAGQQFDYMLSNPPFGVEWKKVEKFIKAEHEQRGFSGRFGAGLPRISDGSLLFLLHMISKMKPQEKGGSRLAIVFNGSPLFTGGAGSGESDIRRWIIENDLLEGIVGLPEQLFYNTGISTYVWVVSNRKPADRKGKVQLINAAGFFRKMARSMGDKRNEISEEQIAEIVGLYGDFAPGEHSRIFDNSDFGYHRITVERPLRLNFQTSAERLGKLNEALDKLPDNKKTDNATRDGLLKALQSLDGSVLHKNRESFTNLLKQVFKKTNVNVPATLLKQVLASLSEKDASAEICQLPDGSPEADADLRDYENVPLNEDIKAYFRREVLPHVPDAWIDHDKTKVGYEINFTRYFYKYKPLRSLAEIRADILKLEQETGGMIKEVLGL